MDHGEEECWVLSLTKEEAEALLAGETVAFDHSGAIIDPNPTFLLEVE